MSEKELMTQSSRNVVVDSNDPAAVAAAETAKARIQSAYIMALQRPRDADQARTRILHACKRPTFAEKVCYSKPIGKSAITGASIRFAELALREWGNVLVDLQIVYEDEKIRRSRVVIADLETNTTFTKEIVVGKTVERRSSTGREVLSSRINSYGDTVYIVIATEEEVQVKESAMVSKAIRNEGLRLIPADIIEEAIEISKLTLRNKTAADPDAAKRKIIDSFATIGVQPKDLKTYLGHSVEQISPAEVDNLRAVYQTIADNEATWFDYVKAQDTDKEPDPNADPATRIKGKINGGQK
jgi:hypothetical protein